MKPYYIYIIGIILCITSCTHHSQEWKTLQDVETYIEEHADSALLTLQNIRPEYLVNKEEKAKHALLLSMAMDKNYIDRTDFEVLQPAIDYYPNHGTATDKLRTFYYEGRIYTNQGDNASAIICFNKALDEGQDSDDLLTKARTHFVQANIYLNLYKIEPYIKENKHAAELFKRKGLQNSYANCLIRIINGYILKNDKENAEKNIRICQSILHSISKKRQREFYTAYLSYTINNGVKEDIITTLNEYRASIPNEESDWLSIADAYLTLNDYDKAYFSIQNYQLGGNIKQDIRYYATLTRILQKSKQPEKALEAYKTYSYITDSIDLAIYEQTTRLIEKHHESELQTIKEQEKKERITFFSVIAILILMIVCVWIHRRLYINTIKKKHLENENEKYRLQLLGIEEERNNLKQLLSNRKEELSETARITLMERLALLNRFFTAYITNSDASTDKLRKEIEALIADRDIFMNTTRLSFAASHPWFIKYLVTHGLTEWEINYCCLYAVGLKGKEIGTYIKMSSHYNQSSIIRGKLGINEHDTNLGIYIRKLLERKRVD